MELQLGKLLRSPKTVVSDTIHILERALRDLRADLRRAATARSHDAEVIHLLRVGSRRITAALSLLRHAGCSVRDGALRRSLRQLRRATGALRDADVRWIEFLAARPRTASPGWSFLGGAIRHAQHNALRDWQTHRHRVTDSVCQVIDEMERHLEANRKACRRRSSTRRWKRWLKKKYATWRALALEAGPAELHPVRIAGKKLRYLLELLTSKKNKPVEVAITPLRNLQSCLGNLRDAQLLGDWLNALGEDLPREAVAALAIWRRRLARSLQHGQREYQRLRSKLA